MVWQTISVLSRKKAKAYIDTYWAFGIKNYMEEVVREARVIRDM